MKIIITILSIMILPLLGFAQNQVTKDYVEKYKGIAIREMKRTGIPASITLAQGILESASGESNLAKQFNNHFGIKCKTEWTGPKTYQNDDTKNECFRVYPNADSSYRDHANFLKNRPYYSSLFELDPVDDTAWAYGLKKAGYATERDYPQRLLKIIDDYELAQYNYPELVAEDSILATQQQPNKSIVVVKKDTLPVVKPIIKIADSIITKIKPTPTNDTIVIQKVPDTIHVPIIKEQPKPQQPLSIVKKDTIQIQKDSANSNINAETKSAIIKKAVPVYPLNQRFKINQTTAVWGVKGRSFLEIANTYNISLYKLYKFNELPETDLIENDQIIFLGEKRKESNNKIHIVKNEETLYEISQEEGIQLNVLKLYNPKLNNDRLKDGTIVYLFNMVNNTAPALTKDTIKVLNTNQKPKSLLSLPFFKNKSN
jgi:LysM repeat protein